MADADRDASPSDGETCDLSLQEAADLYEVALATLARKVRLGQVSAYKIRGPWGREWRVSRHAMEAAGYRRRPPAAESTDPRVAALEQQVAHLRRVVAAERYRADRADRELGSVMLECGRLRSALARAQGVEPDAPAAWPSRPSVGASC